MRSRWRAGTCGLLAGKQLSIHIRSAVPPPARSFRRRLHTAVRCCDRTGAALYLAVKMAVKTAFSTGQSTVSDALTSGGPSGA